MIDSRLYIRKVKFRWSNSPCLNKETEKNKIDFGLFPVSWIGSLHRETIL